MSDNNHLQSFPADYFSNQPTAEARQSGTQKQSPAPYSVFPEGYNYNLDQIQHQQLFSFPQLQQQHRRPLAFPQLHQQSLQFQQQNQQSIPFAQSVPFQQPHTYFHAFRQQQTVVAASPMAPPSASLTSNIITHERLVADPNVFYAALQNLHGNKLKIPTYEGLQLDMHRLYVEVTKRGGLHQANKTKTLNEIAAAFNMPQKDLPRMLRHYYMKLLNVVEQTYFKPQDQSVVNPSASTSVVGVIDGKFDYGYVATIKQGSTILKGVLYHSGLATPDAQYAGVSPFNTPVNTLNSLNPSPSTERTRQKKRQRIWKTDPNHPKPNRSGYNFFFAKIHAQRRASNSEKDRELSKTIGEMWNKLRDEEKAIYRDLGQKDKERYQRELKEYKEKGNANVNSTSFAGQQPSPMRMSSVSTSQLSIKIEPSNLNFKSESIAAAQLADANPSTELHCPNHEDVHERSLTNDHSSFDARMGDFPTQPSHGDDNFTIESIPAQSTDVNPSTELCWPNHENVQESSFVNEQGTFDARIGELPTESSHGDCPIPMNVEPSNLDFNPQSIPAQSMDVNPSTDLHWPNHKNIQESSFVNEQSTFNNTVGNLPTQPSYFNDSTQQALLKLQSDFNENIDTFDGSNTTMGNDSALLTDIKTSAVTNFLDDDNADH